MTRTSAQNLSRTLLAGVAVIAVLIAASVYLNAPDRRTPGQKVGEAMDQIADGDLKSAGRALEDRTPGEKLGDAIQDAGDDVEKKYDQK